MSSRVPMSVFEHYVAHLTIAHHEAVRAARAHGPSPTREQLRHVSGLTIKLIRRMHRLDTLVAEMGAPAVFGTPPAELGADEVRRLFPEPTE